VPAYWSEEHGCELELQVAQAAHVLEQLDALLESDDVRSVLERDGVVVNVLDRGYAGSMGNLRHWANVLGARAVVRARAWDASGAAQSLVRAAELQALVDDRTGRGLAFRSMVIAIVMMAAERVLEISPYAAPTLRQELEPILARFAAPEGAHEAYSADVAWFLRQTNGYRGAWDVSPAYRIELLRTADGLLDLMDEAFPGELYFQRSVPYAPSAELTWKHLHRL
jgi:hypothetical protein